MKKTLFLTSLLIFLLSTVSPANLQMELKDSQGQTVYTEYQVLKDGSLINSSTNTLNVDLTKNKNYTIKQKASTSKGWYNVTFYELNITQDLNPKTQMINTTIPDDKTYLTDKSNTYAADTSNLKFSKSKIRSNSVKEPDRVAHCLEYDYQASECTNWNINSTTDYSSTYSSDIFEFNVTEFDGYASGTTAPYPNISEIRVYDVGDTMDNREGGELVEQGLNSSFTLPQYGPAEYRFEFQVYNNGSRDWEIVSEDLMFEDGLEGSWKVSDIFYELGAVNDGGAFSNGKVSWNMDNGGILDLSGANDTLEANFVLDLDLGDSFTTDNRFKVEDTSEDSGTDAQHKVDWKKLGDLNVSISEPPNDTVVSKNRFFQLNGSVECLEGVCGQVSVSPRYNETFGSFSLIREDSGTAFYTNTSSEKVCGTLSESEKCDVSWYMNSTGDVESWHKVDLNASSNYTEIPESSSSFSEIQINEMVILNLSWDQTDFGYINPGEEDKPAEGNANKEYNITVGEKSMNVDNIYVKGQDLISVKDDTYSIGITNLTMTTELSSRNFTVKKDYTKILSDISAGTSINTKYWLDAPLGRTQGAYSGSMTFKANSTS